MSDALDWIKQQCNRYTNGTCTNTACFKRAGWTAETRLSCDYDKWLQLATCEAHEAVTTIASLRAENERSQLSITLLNERCRQLERQYKETTGDLRLELEAAGKAFDSARASRDALREENEALKLTEHQLRELVRCYTKEGVKQRDELVAMRADLAQSNRERDIEREKYEATSRSRGEIIMERDAHLKNLLQYEDAIRKCRNSVVEATIEFPNVGAYIEQVETQRETLAKEVEKLRAADAEQRDKNRDGWQDRYCACEIANTALEAKLSVAYSERDALRRTLTESCRENDKMRVELEQCRASRQSWMDFALRGGKQPEFDQPAPSEPR